MPSTKVNETIPKIIFLSFLCFDFKATARATAVMGAYRFVAEIEILCYRMTMKRRGEPGPAGQNPCILSAGGQSETTEPTL